MADPALSLNPQSWNCWPGLRLPERGDGGGAKARCLLGNHPGCPGWADPGSDIGSPPLPQQSQVPGVEVEFHPGAFEKPKLRLQGFPTAFWSWC